MHRCIADVLRWLNYSQDKNTACVTFPVVGCSCYLIFRTAFPPAISPHQLPLTLCVVPQDSGVMVLVVSGFIGSMQSRTAGTSSWWSVKLVEYGFICLCDKGK